jgi:hypothetical protein
MSSRNEKILPPGVPNCLKKRRLLNEKGLSPALCREYGEKFLALDWREDALEFFQMGKDMAGLEKIKALALETGDAYLLARTGKEHPPELWRAVADRAMDLGKLHFAHRALTLAGENDRAEALASLLRGDHQEP